MKRFFLVLPALLVSAAFLIWYRIGATEEARLGKTWGRMEMQIRDGALGEGGKDTPSPETAKPETRPQELDSAEKREAFLTHWTRVVREGQQQVLDAGKRNE